MTGEGGFNLLDEPWIIVLAPDGRERLVSILGVFEQAPRLSMIGGEVPTQAFAITRLLLAFLHRAIDGPADQEQWAQLWAAPELPMAGIRTYAERVRHRFDLFDAEAPFFQVAGLRTSKGTIAHLRKIVADLPDPGKDDLPLFTTRTVASLATMNAAEAARWLIHVHAFDPAGTKSGAVGDPRVSNGKGYGSSSGWSGQLGGVLPQGADLKQTLLLNLIARDAGAYVRVGGPGDVPPWEREPDDASWFDDRPPRGAVDLYTWQTRRVRLVGDRTGVTGVILANGDKIQPQNRHGLDPHTAWRYSEPQSEKLHSTVYMPRMHDPSRSVWRGIAALLPSISPRRGSGGVPQPFLAPGVLQWIGDLGAEGHLPEAYVPQVRVQGVKYGSNNTVYEEIVDDVLLLSVTLLRGDRPDAGRTAEGAVADAEQAALCLWNVAENIAQAGGAEPKSGAGDRAREALYATLDARFREWLARLAAGGDLTAARAEWQVTVRTACRLIVDELIVDAPTTAWTGREIGNRLVNVALAEAWFHAAVRKALPLAVVRSPEKTQEVVR